MRALFFLLLTVLFVLPRASAFAGEVCSERQRTRIVFGSCVSAPETSIWEQMHRYQPDFFIMLGDSYYLPEQAEIELASFQKLQNMLAAQPGFRTLRATSETFAIWDDHDYGHDNATESFQSWKTSEDVFREFWKIHERPTSFERGIHHAVLRGNLLFIMTDNRSFRNEPGDENADHFGIKQLEWVEQLLSEHPKAQLAVLVSGGDILGRGPESEGLYQYPREQRRLLQIIERSPIPIVILSGDRHFAQLLKGPTFSWGTLFQLTSSPLSAGMAPEGKVRQEEPARVGAYFRESPNFGFVEICGDEAQLSVELGVRAVDGSTPIRHTIVFSDGSTRDR